MFTNPLNYDHQRTCRWGRSYFVEAIHLFLESRCFLETQCIAGSLLLIQLKATPLVFDALLTVLSGDIPCITADDVSGSKLLALESYVPMLPHSPDLSRAPSFQSNRTVIQSVLNANLCSRSMARPPEVDLALSGHHGSHGHLVPWLQLMFQYLSPPKIAQGTIGFYYEKTHIPRGTLQES
jgi:hypothetical protein